MWRGEHCGVERYRISADAAAGQPNGFAQAQVARAGVAVVLVENGIDRQIQPGQGLSLIRADVDAKADPSQERRAALVVGRSHDVKARVARINRQTAGEQRMRLGRSAVER